MSAIKYPVFNRKLDENLKTVFNDILKSNWVSSGGSFNHKFENSIKNKFKIKHCSTISSGTAALEAALFSLNLNKNDEVIVPSFTIVSCINVIIRLGLKPRIVDVDPNSWCLNLSILKKKITSKTKAIIYVHIFGNSDEIDLISKFCKYKKIFLLEDCAESMFTSYNNKLTGTFGDISTFSLYTNKLITSGEGGFVLTNNDKLFNRVESYKNLFFGIKDRFEHKNLGFNYRLTNVQAAIAWQDLKSYKKYIKLNNFIGNKYRNYLDLNKFEFQKINIKCQHIFWMVPILFKRKINIKKVQSKLFSFGIDTRRLFKPLSSLKFLEKFNIKLIESPSAEHLYNRGIYIPCGHDLTVKDIEHISKILNKLAV